MVAAVKGYRMLVVMPAGMSGERVAISRAFGAEVLEIGRFHVNEALAKAKELGQEPGYFCPAQFESEWNVEENRTWLGPEILAQLPEGIVPDALVMGVGTGGTLVGVGQAFREANPDVKLYAMEPDESCTILCGEVGEHLIEGISDGFVPGIFSRHGKLVDDALTVESKEAIEEMRRMAREYGLFVGPVERRKPHRRPQDPGSESPTENHRNPLLRRGRKVHPGVFRRGRAGQRGDFYLSRFRSKRKGRSKKTSPFQLA